MIGLCNLKADFERLTERTEDGMGGHEEVWTPFKTSWPCRMQSPRSREQAYLDKREVSADAIVYGPYFAGLTEKDRMRLNGRTFSISLVDNWNEAGIYLKVYVQETKE